MATSSTPAEPSDAADPSLAASVAQLQSADERTRAFVRVYEGLRSASGSEAAGPLRGVRVGLKDNIALSGHPLTCGSKSLEGYVSPFSATAVERLLEAGMEVVGHTNMDEFGMGSSCENSAFFATRNPWSLDRVPGGSSGGSAAAVAAGLVPVALGTDTGGSIRQPAAFCGVVGLKPTYGRVSRFGLVAFASSLDQIGPITRSVGEAAAVLEVIAGSDPRDATSSDQPCPQIDSALERGIEGLRVGVIRQFDDADKVRGLTECVRSNWATTVDSLRAAGAEIVEIDVAAVHAAIATYYLIANSEASANLARFDGIRYGRRADASSLGETYRLSRSQGLGREVKRRILLGTFALSSGYYDAYYGKAVSVAAQLTREFAAALERCDVVMTPTTPSGAFRLGEKIDDPLSMYLSDVFTTPASLAGLPAIAVPSGVDRDGLPLSMQFIGPPFREDLVLRCARWLELAQPIGQAPNSVGSAGFGHQRDDSG